MFWKHTLIVDKSFLYPQRFGFTSPLFFSHTQGFMWNALQIIEWVEK